MKMCTKNSGKIGFGLVLILAGIVYLASNLGFFPAHFSNILFSWPMILVAIGLVNLFNKELIAATIFLTIAAYFLLPDLFPGIHADQIWQYWPMLLIIIGVLLITKHRKRFHPPVNAFSSHDEVFDIVSIFGGRIAKIENHDFRGGRITAIFGGSEINLVNSNIVNSPAVIEITAIFGGTKILVPRDWNVKVEVTSIFGGFTDKRLFVADSANTSKTLIIKGETIFGGGELSNI